MWANSHFVLLCKNKINNLKSQETIIKLMKTLILQNPMVRKTFDRLRNDNHHDRKDINICLVASPS